MKEAVQFLGALGTSIDLVRERGPGAAETLAGLETARELLEILRIADPGAVFRLSGEAITWRDRPVGAASDWPWTEALRSIGVTTLDPPDEPTRFVRWIESLSARLSAPGGDAGSGERSVEPASARAGEASGLPDAARGTGGSSLDEESSLVQWLHGEAANRGRLPRQEAVALVERLAGRLDDHALHARSWPLGPFDGDDTMHCLNVALLAMGLARHLQFETDEVLTIGLCALLHDVGKVRLGGELPEEADPQSPEVRALLQRHPGEGARLLLDSGPAFAPAAVVAWEHHVGWEGRGGYPARHYLRAPHRFSRIVTVCDTYDVLRSERGFRAALSDIAAQSYLHVLAGRHLDPEIVTGLVGFLGTGHARIPRPRVRAEAELSDLRWLPDDGFDPDCEPAPIRI